MTIFVCKNINDETTGVLTKYMYEVAPGIFINTLTKKQRDTLTKYITTNNKNPDLLIAYEYTGQPTFETYGNPTRFTTDFDGTELLTRNFKTNKTLRIILAKPDKSLIDHILETGWTAKILLENSIYRANLISLSNKIGIYLEELKNIICFIIALHDIGKVHPFFQCKFNTEGMLYLKKNEMLPKSMIGAEGFRHEQYSKQIVEEYFENKYGYSKWDSSILGDMVLYHHQNKKRQDPDSFQLSDELKKKYDETIINPIIEIVEKEFPFTKIPLDDYVDALGHFTLGLMMISDRISSCGLFGGIEY